MLNAYGYPGQMFYNSQGDLVVLLGKCSILTCSGLVDILACAFSKMELYDGHTEERRRRQV